MNSSPPSGGVAVISRYGAAVLLAGAAVAISYPFRAHLYTTPLFFAAVYPGYYADVEPYYNNEGVYDSVPAADPNVTAVQNDLTKLGYYHGPVDGLYGRATRDAVARYQNDHHLAITGTLTTQTLQSLGVSPSVAS